MLKELDLTISTWFLALSPVLVILIGLLCFHLEASKVGALSWIIATFVANNYFGANMRHLALANSKGLFLALYVLLIIWGAIFLYCVADGAGAIKVIGDCLQKVTKDRVLLSILLAWCFTSLLQGLAGFGVPVAVVAPIMVAIGFSPMTALASCLIGHSWSITFGSMGSSYNSIQLVTKISGDIIGPEMALLFSPGIFLTGLEVLHINGGFGDVKKGWIFVAFTGLVMSCLLWFMNYIGVSQLASLSAGISGCGMLCLFAKITNKTNMTTSFAHTGSLSFNIAAMPYYLLIIISIITQIPVIKLPLGHYYWALDFPRIVTDAGYVVEGVRGYSKIKYFSHPAPILFLSAICGYFVYVIKANKPVSLLKESINKTLQKCIPTSIGITTMVMMALIMIDSGMTNLIARGIANTLGNLYPFASPFIGTLGTFITGSNTNSNIMFGALQVETAKILGANSVLIASSQSVGGSLGVSMAPSTIMMGSINVGLLGRENEVMSKTIKYCLLNTAIIGFIAWLLA